MNVLVIDAQGGGIGKALVEAVKASYPSATVIAVGTNSAATVAMKKAGADHVATGENAVAVCARSADVITGPIGIAIADSLWGEISPKMALAVGESRARKVLLPMNQCENIIVRVSDLSVSTLVKEAVKVIGKSI